MELRAFAEDGEGEDPEGFLPRRGEPLRASAEDCEVVRSADGDAEGEPGEADAEDEEPRFFTDAEEEGCFAGSFEPCGEPPRRAGGAAAPTGCVQ